MFGVVATVSTITTSLLNGTVSSWTTVKATIANVDTLTVTTGFIGTLSVSSLLAATGVVNTTSGNIQSFNSSVSYIETLTAIRAFRAAFNNAGTYYGLKYPAYFFNIAYLNNLNGLGVGAGTTLSRFSTSWNNSWFEFKEAIAIQSSNNTWSTGNAINTTLTLILRGVKGGSVFSLTLAKFDAAVAAYAYATGSSMSQLFTPAPNSWSPTQSRYWVSFDNLTTLDLIMVAAGAGVTTAQGTLQFRMTVEDSDVAIDGGNPW